MKPTRVVPVAVVALLALGLVAALPHLGHHGPGRGEAFVTMHGVALVTRSGGRVQTIRGRTTLHPGDRLRMQKGRAALELSDGVGYQARAATGHDAASSLQMGDRPSLDAGPLLVTAQHGARVQVAQTTVSLVGVGAMRLSQSLATAVGVYRGEAQVDSAGATGQVAALRSLEIAAPGDVPHRSQPLAYSPSDSWDREFLGDAISVDSQLRSLLAGFHASGGHPANAALKLRPDLHGPPSATELQALLRDRHDADGMLVGTAISGLGQGGSFRQRWDAVFAFRDDGAAWGLVAMDRAVGPEDLVDLLAKVIDVTTFAFADTGGVRVADADLSRTTAPGADSGAAGGVADTVPGTSPDGGGDGGANGTGTGGTSSPAAGPGATVPGVTLPGGVTIPGITLPGPGTPVTLPPVDVPLTTPGVSIGPITIPPISLPPITLPTITLPTLPKGTPPLPTLPKVTLPPILGPIL
ncbi:MAG TPA: hypothetical protein VGM93_15615 [Acidimicrobiales bacterium]